MQLKPVYLVYFSILKIKWDCLYNWLILIGRVASRFFLSSLNKLTNVTIDIVARPISRTSSDVMCDIWNDEFRLAHLQSIKYFFNNICK